MKYQEYRTDGHKFFDPAWSGEGYWAVADKSRIRESTIPCIAQHEAADVSLVRVGIVRLNLFPTDRQPGYVTFPNLDSPHAKGVTDMFWVESAVPPGELDLFRLRARLAGLETTLFHGKICDGHGPVTLMLAEMSIRVDLFINDLDNRLTDPEIEGGHYDLPEVTNARVIKGQLEGYAAAIEAPDFLRQLKHSVQPTGQGARDLARALVRFGMKAATKNREAITLVYQYIEALQDHQEAGHLSELTGADCADFIGKHWELGDRGFREMLAKPPAQPSPTVEPESTRSEVYPGLETSSVRLPDGSTLRVVHDGTIAMLFRETDRDNAEPIATGDLASIASRATEIAEQTCPPRSPPKKHASTKNTALGNLRQMVLNRLARGV